MVKNSARFFRRPPQSVRSLLEEQFDVITLGTVGEGDCLIQVQVHVSDYFQCVLSPTC